MYDKTIWTEDVDPVTEEPQTPVSVGNLNKIEEGIASKADCVEGDQTKAANAAAWLYLEGPVVPGETVLLESLEEKTTNTLASASTITNGPVVKKFRVARAGRYRVTGEIANQGGAVTTTVGVLVEGCPGSVVATEIPGTTFSQFSLDLLTMAIPGNIIEVRLGTNNASSAARVRNVRVKYAEPSGSHGYTNSVVLS